MSPSARRLLPLAAVFIPALTGCILTSDSVVAEADATFDPRLLGSWEVLGDSDRAVVTRGAGNQYRIDFTDDKGATGTFHARLGPLGGRTVLDVWPAEPTLDTLSAGAAMFVPQHLPLAIDIRDNEVHTALLNGDSVAAALEAARLSSGYVISERRIVLLGTTSELRSALAPYVARPGAFGAPDFWRRTGSAPADR